MNLSADRMSKVFLTGIAKRWTIMSFFVSSQLASALEQIFTVITFEIFLRFVDKLVNLQSFRNFETLWTLITYIWPLITVYFSVVP